MRATIMAHLLRITVIASLLAISLAIFVGSAPRLTEWVVGKALDGIHSAPETIQKLAPPALNLPRR